MRTGISTASLFMRQNTENAVVAIEEWGAQCCEVFLSTFYEYRPEFAREMVKTLKAPHICSIHAQSPNFEHQLFSPSRRVRGDGFYWLDQIMRSAQIMGCTGYTFHGLIRFRGDEKAEPRYLGEAVEFCARYGVKLCLENVAWSLYNKPGIFAALKNEISGLRGVLDVKQARRSGYPLAMYINDMRGAIERIHLSDVDGNGNICLPGRGKYDFAEIIKRAADAGFDGDLLIEVYPENYGDVCELKQSLDYINETVYKIS